ncbi:hypothetical protein [Halovivax sp.]|uniref:DUF7853 family protein n=1 Tax=Halovivax sp. TaxID=1935978 RepID=UPI0025C45399|nr:hypothetical protein [Halovivax sp.]
MARSSDQQDFSVDLSREEQWLLHHVLLDRVESALQAPAETDPPPVVVYRVFDELETGRHRFTESELAYLRTASGRYVEATGTPDRDRSVAFDLLERVHRTAAAVAAIEPAS